MQGATCLYNREADYNKSIEGNGAPQAVQA
jgi:hypothetical protein